MPITRKPNLSLIERRRSPRYSVDIPCQVMTYDGVATQGLIRDMSLTGLQLQGNAGFVRTLYPNFKRANWRTPLKITIKILLPTSKKRQVNVEFMCQLVYCSRREPDLYKVGCQYLDIHPDIQAALLDHIRHFGIPKET